MSDSTRRTRFWAGAVLASVLVAGTLPAADLYVSPTGTPGGDGGKENPLDVFTALSAKSPAKPGDTIYLMGGIYEGKMTGTKRVPFDLHVSGTAENPVRIMPVPGQAVHLNGTADFKSSYAHYFGLDIGDLLWDITGKKHQDETALWVSGGEGAKVINCNIFGGSMGTGLWSTARNIEVYGCLVHDFGGASLSPDGTLTAGRGHGHAFYTQNETGTKTIQDCIAYRGCGWNLHIYTQQGEVRGYEVIENIMYIAGSAVPGQTMDNYLVSAYKPADRIHLIGNVGYEPYDVQKWRADARLANYQPITNHSAVAKDNYLMGAYYGFSIGDWEKVEFTSNTIWATGIFVEINSAPTGSGVRGRTAKPNLAGYALHGNTYIDNGQPKPFNYGMSEKPQEGDLLDFASWQKLGLDKDSTVIPGKNGRPTGSKVFVFPNKYQKGRANIGIFNWDGKDTIDADLSKVLDKGQAYQVYNCLDIKQTIGLAKPVLTGAYDGAAVAFPMRKDKISPDFDAFLVLPAGK